MRKFIILFLLSSISFISGCFVLEGSSENDIRKIDFNNFTYPEIQCIYYDKASLDQICETQDSGLKPLRTFTLVDGIYDTFPDEKELWTQFELSDVIYADFNSDNISDALVVINYITVTASGQSEYLAYVFTMEDNEVKIMSKFAQIPDIRLMNEIELKYEGHNHDRFSLNVKDNRIYVSDGFGNRGRCCPEYSLIFKGEFKESELIWQYSLDKLNEK